MDKNLQGNERIKEVLDKWEDELTEDVIEELVSVIQERMLEDGEFLLPVQKLDNNPDSDSDNPGTDSSNPGADSDRYQLKSITDDDDTRWIPVFTDEDEFELGPASEKQSLLIDRIFDKVIDIDDVKGVIINPWTDSVRMKKPMLWWILEERKPREDDYTHENKLIDKAIIFATSAHTGQLRKGTTEPYITHPLQVMSVLNEMGADTNLLIAGLLHDALEDTGMTDEDILWDFGPDVLELVNAHTEDKSKSWEERKQHTINAIPNLPVRAKMLIMADKVANLRSMARDYKAVGEELWDRFNRGKEKICWYYSKVQDALEEMQFYNETRDVYWEMVELFKDLFVSYYYDEEKERIIQMADNGEGYMSGRYMDGARRWDQEIPAGMIEISRGRAERYEDNWEDERGVDSVMS